MVDAQSIHPHHSLLAPDGGAAEVVRGVPEAVGDIEEYIVDVYFLPQTALTPLALDGFVIHLVDQSCHQEAAPDGAIASRVWL